MGFEVIRSETKPCWCKKSTITYITEMNDWNQTRHDRIIDCKTCAEKARKEAETKATEKKRNEALYQKAKKFAESRYLKQWLIIYSGVSTKEAWSRYTQGKGYPALGTFYKHVKDMGGVEKYMSWCFSNNFESALTKMKVDDEEIESILSQRK